MKLTYPLASLLCGALLAFDGSQARAEGAFDIPPGAHFNQDKLAKVTEFFKNEVATGKIAGANVLSPPARQGGLSRNLRRA